MENKLRNGWRDNGSITSATARLSGGLA